MRPFYVDHVQQSCLDLHGPERAANMIAERIAQQLLPVLEAWDGKGDWKVNVALELERPSEPTA